MPVSDGRVVASAAGATLLVASAGSASRAAVRDAVERLALIAVAPTAAVLNKSKSRQARGYYGRPLRDRSPEERNAVKVGERA